MGRRFRPEFPYYQKNKASAVVLRVWPGETMMSENTGAAKRNHDPFFRWLFSDTGHARNLLELSAKVNRELNEFLSVVNLDTLIRIPDSYSEVDETGEADIAFRVNVATGAPVLVGILLEHKSGRDVGILEQIDRYVHSVMRLHEDNRIFSGFPTMAIIFYNGRENWDPLKLLENGYPKYFHGSVLPFKCTFINMSDIPDSDCLACEDTETGMGIVAMKYAFDKDNLLTVLPQFKSALQKMDGNKASCLLQKISLYLKEYVDQCVLKELSMAFKSIGQKYGFVSAGDVFRQQIADARVEEQQKTEAKANEEKLNTARGLLQDGVSMEILTRRFNLSEEAILGK
jgi:hypothetical protein